MTRQEFSGDALRRAISSGNTRFVGASVTTALGPAIRKGYDDIFEKTAFVTHYQGASLLNVGESAVSVTGEWAQSTFPEIFGFHMLAGTSTALKDPSNVLISQSTAVALFGHNNPIGKTIRRDAKSSFCRRRGL